MTAQDLWPGADVRVLRDVGRLRRRGLEPGDRAVVVDPGRHHITSVSTVYRVVGQRRPRRRARGVMIRLEDGTETTVPRSCLELVAPDHPLAAEPDGTVADWFRDQLAPWSVEEGVPVASLVPQSLEAVAQVLHPWPLEGRRATWREVAQEHGYGSVRELDQTRSGHTLPVANDIGTSPTEGDLDDDTAAVLVEVLKEATSTPHEVYVAIWEGWGDIPPDRFPGAARITTPGRGHFLLRGPLHGVLHSVSISRAGGRPAAGLWWPADRAWFVATEIDFQWTFVAGRQELIDTLIADPRLEVAPARFDDAANEAHEPTGQLPDE